MEHENLILEVNTIFKTYNVNNAEKISIIKHWLGLQFIETLMQEEQRMCNTVESLTDILINKFHPQHNATIKSTQYCKLSRQSGENSEEWMGILRIGAGCTFKEIERQLKEQFIHGPNDNVNVNRN